jgi:hypothetical protein
MRDDVARWCKNGLSWVSLDDHGKIVGFLLGEMHSPLTLPAEFRGVDLTYGGVLKDYRSAGRFGAVLARAMAIGRPLRAVVKHANKGGMAKGLVKAGFIRAPALAGGFDNEDAFLWTPAGRP